MLRFQTQTARDPTGAGIRGGRRRSPRRLISESWRWPGSLPLRPLTADIQKHGALGGSDALARSYADDKAIACNGAAAVTSWVPAVAPAENDEGSL